MDAFCSLLSVNKVLFSVLQFISSHWDTSFNYSTCNLLMAITMRRKVSSEEIKGERLKIDCSAHELMWVMCYDDARKAASIRLALIYHAAVRVLKCNLSSLGRYISLTESSSQLPEPLGRHYAAFTLKNNLKVWLCTRKRLMHSRVQAASFHESTSPVLTAPLMTPLKGLRDFRALYNNAEYTWETCLKG